MFRTIILKGLVLITFLIVSNNISSQMLYAGSEVFIPPNPDVAAFVKYVESSVSFSTGSVQINFQP